MASFSTLARSIKSVFEQNEGAERSIDGRYVYAGQD
jgi:hypothetical protein